MVVINAGSSAGSADYTVKIIEELEAIEELENSNGPASDSVVMDQEEK